MSLIGIDIGGSHITAGKILASRSGFSTSSKLSKSFDSRLASDELIRGWADVIREVAGSEVDLRLGIAFPGPFDYKNGISLIKDQDKFRSLFGLSIKNLLAVELQIDTSQIKFINDAEAFLLGEFLAGKAKGVDKAMGITLGTGLGTSLKVGEVIKDAKLWQSPFKNGIAEEYLNTGWFVQEATEAFGIELRNVKELVDKKELGKERAALFKQFGRNLGEFLLPYLIRIQADTLVIGGKISRAFALFLPETQKYLNANQCTTELAISNLGEDAGLIAAAGLFSAQHNE